MSLQHFFLDRQVLSEQTDDVFALDLSGEDINHAKVLRLAAGEHIAVIDAAQDYFECEISAFDGNTLSVRIANRLKEPKPCAQVILVQGLAKSDRFEEVLRHATELGVSAFVPFACERSVVKLDKRKTENKLLRWQGVVKSAAMQSGQLCVPAILAPKSLDDVCAAAHDAHALLIFWEEAQGGATLKASIKAALQAQASGENSDNVKVMVVVGPEGGLTHQEVDMLCASNPNSAVLSLGSTILRTETAGVVASALTLYELGGLGGNSISGNVL